MITMLPPAVWWLLGVNGGAMIIGTLAVRTTRQIWKLTVLAAVLNLAGVIFFK